EAMADQKRRWTVRLAHCIRRGDHIGDAAAETTVGKIAAALAEPRKVEAQHTIAQSRQRPTEPNGGNRAFRAGEAMSEQCIGSRGTVGQVQSTGEMLSLCTDEIK